MLLAYIGPFFLFLGGGSRWLYCRKLSLASELALPFQGVQICAGVITLSSFSSFFFTVWNKASNL